MKVSRLPDDRKHETKLSPPRTQVGKAIIWWVQITGGNVGGGGVDGVERMTRIKEGKRRSRCKRRYRAQYDEVEERNTPQSLTTEHNVEGGSPVG